jgi:WD40 repeat protein
MALHSDSSAPEGAPSKARIFISYSRKDVAFVDRLEAALKARGFEPKIDRGEISDLEDWRNRIGDLIAQADDIIFVLSPDSLASPECRKEVDYATSLNKRFAPVVCRRVDDSAVPEALARIHRIDFVDTPFDATVDRLVRALETDIAWVRKHTEFGEQARRWSEAGRPGPRGLLLRPPVLEEAESWIAARPPNAPPPTETTAAFIAESRRAAIRRRNVVAVSSTAGAIITLGLSAVAYLQYGRAVERRNAELLTQSRALADTANQTLGSGDAGTALLLALEALPTDTEVGVVKRPYTPEAEVALLSAWQRLLETLVIEGPSASRWAVFSPDDHYILNAPEDGREARLRNISTGETNALLHNGAIYSAAFSPDGLRVVTASKDKTARVWDPANPHKEIAVLTHPSEVWSAAFSSDGRRVLTTSGPTARIWDSVTGQMITAVGFDTGSIAAALSSDGKRILSWMGRGARIWDATTGKAAKAFGHQAPVNDASFSPDNHRVVTASDDKTARVWDVETGRSVMVLNGHAAAVLRAVFSPDGRWVLTRSSDRTSRIWEVATGNAIHVLSGHRDVLNAAIFSSDGRRVATVSSDGTARLWDANSGQTLQLIKVPQGRVDSVVFSADSRRIATTQGKTVRMFKTEPEVKVLSHAQRVWRAAFSADGRRIATASADKTASIWDAETGKLVVSLGGHQKAVSSVAFSREGRRVLTGSEDGTARIWDVETGKTIAVFIGHGDTVESVAFSPDARRVVTASFDKTARVWDAETGKPVAVLDGHTDYVYDAAFSPDGLRIITGSRDGTARIWDAASGAGLIRLSGDANEVRHAAFSPDGRRIITATVRRLHSNENAAARLWDAETGKQLLVLAQDKVSIFAVYSPDGRRVLTVGSASGSVWDAETGELIVLLLGHTDALIRGAFSKSGARIVTGSRDKTARIWDAATGKTVGILTHDQMVYMAEFSHDERRVVTASEDTTARVWPVFPMTQKLLDQAKQVTPRCLTREQREAAILDLVPPIWCIEMEKWPYNGENWKLWLKYMRTGTNPPLPDTPEWQTWIASRR